MPDLSSSNSPKTERQLWMGQLAKARFADLSGLWRDFGDKPDWEFLRRPETGMVMVRARAGGDGQRFNMGEMTMTRCTVRLSTTEASIGHGYVAGRNPDHAEIAAIVDALMQEGEQRAALQTAILEPLAKLAAERAGAKSEKIAATKVDFFTVARERE